MAAAMIQHQPVASSSRSAPAARVPAFLTKLYAMVEDASVDRLIHWNEAEDGFVVPYPEQFARELLPRFFKHSNFGSFVRQLNMYGFGKVLHMQQGVLKSEPGDNTESLEFKNENFKRGQQDLLQYIHRKKTGQAAEEKAVATTNTATTPITNQGIAVDLHTLLNDVSTVRQHQNAISTDLKGLAESNKQLWQEAIESRTRHQKHQETINKIVRFLGTVFGGKVLSPGNSPAPSPTMSSADVSSSNIPRQKRLLLKDRAEDDQTSPRVREIEVPLDELEDLPLISGQHDDNDFGASRFSTLADSPPMAHSPPDSHANTNSNGFQLGQLFSPGTQASLTNFAPNNQPFAGPSEPQQQQLSRVFKDHAAINSQMDNLQANLDRLVSGLNIPPHTFSAQPSRQQTPTSGEDAGDFDLDAFLKTFGTTDQQIPQPSTSAAPMSNGFPDYFMPSAPASTSAVIQEDEPGLDFDELINTPATPTVGTEAKVIEVEDESHVKGRKKRSSSNVSDNGRRSSARKRNKV